MTIEAPPHAVRRLKDDRDIWLVRPPDGTARVVCAWPATAGLRLRSLVGRAAPQRIRRGARRSASAGVPVPSAEPVVRRNDRGGAALVELDRPWIDGETALDLARRGTWSGRTRGLAAMCGAIAARYAGAGLVHRDLKLSNLVVTEGNQVVVVDTDGVRPTGRRAVALARMLDRLGVETVEPPLAVPPALRRTLIRSALRGSPRGVRRAVLRRLR